MRRAVLALFGLGLGLGGCDEPGGQEVMPRPPAESYAAYCALCHGDEGQGYAADAASALANQEFLATAPDALIGTAIELGRPGTSMSAWSTERGGPLTRADVDVLVDYIRAWQTVPSIDVSTVTVTGVAERGMPLWEFQCARCHGTDGQGGPFMSLASSTFLATASDGFLQRAIAKGRPDTPMEAFEDRLTPQGIDDLVTLIRSWQTPVDDTVDPLPVLDPETLVLNPGGPEPALGDVRHVPVDTVKAELDRGAAMVLLDARPPADYLHGHIAGAVSVPFYAVEQFVEQLPRDRWIVTYCACPHAESGEAADVLEANGFTRVRVLDEGVRVWAARGYPMREGAAP